MANIIEITDLALPELAVFSKLTEAQLRNKLEPEKGIFIAESPKVINTALENGYIPLSMLMERKHIDGQAKDIIAKSGDIPVYTADRNVLYTLTGYELTRGILCAMHRPKLKDAKEMCENFRRVCVLEGVVDTTNIGAIFRSAAALNMDAVLLTPTCCDPFNRRAVRVSMGTVFQVPWTYIPNLSDGGLELLKNLGFKTAAMALSDNSVSIDNEALCAEEKLAIIMGTEGDGLSQKTIDGCDYTVKIPMAHGVDSLNVAAASAVAFWELRVR